MKKILLLLLIVSLCLPLLACGQSKEDDDDIDIDIEEDAWYADVDFHGEKLNALYSKTRPVVDNDQIFHFGTKYMAADAISADTVINRCYDRNRFVAKALNINIHNEVSDQQYIGEEVEKYVMLSVAPYDAVIDRAGAFGKNYVNGFLYNLNSDNEKNYFNFNEEDWYIPFMREMTLDYSKYYVMAGDFFISILQGSNCLYLNTTYYETDVERALDMSLSDFCDVVEAREFDYDLFFEIIHNAWHIDTGASSLTIDDSVGLMVNSSYWMYPFIYSTGESMFNRDETGMISFKENITGFQDMVETICKVYHDKATIMDAHGTPVRPTHSEYAKQFVNGNVLFVGGFVLGNMEDEKFLTMDNKLPIPYPLYGEQTDYLTYFDTGSDIGMVLKNTEHFSVLSAYYQLANEKSHDLLAYYYENALKFKYSDDPLSSKMLDIIRATLRAPFEVVMCVKIFENSTLQDIADSPNQLFLNAVISDRYYMVTDKYAANYDAYRKALSLIIKNLEENEK